MTNLLSNHALYDTSIYALKGGQMCGLSRNDAIISASKAMPLRLDGLSHVIPDRPLS